MNLVEFPCPDCDGFWRRSFPIIAMMGPTCPTCGGRGKVLVKREDLIKLSDPVAQK